MVAQALKDLFKKNTVDPELQRAYKTVFSSEDGKKVLEDLLRTCKVNQPSFVLNNEHATAYNEGSRRIGLRILSLLEAQNQHKPTK